MQRSPTIDKFNLLVDELNQRMESQKRGLAFGKERLLGLHNNGFHIEAFMVNAQLLEEAVKGVIRTFLLERAAYDACGLADPYSKVSKDSHEDQPLGNCIYTLQEYTGKTDLTKKLFEFNRKRRDFIHHAFDGSQDAKLLDEESLNVVSDTEFMTMVLGIAGIQVDLQKKIQGMYEQMKMVGLSQKPD